MNPPDQPPPGKSVRAIMQEDCRTLNAARIRLRNIIETSLPAGTPRALCHKLDVDEILCALDAIFGPANFNPGPPHPGPASEFGQDQL